MERVRKEPITGLLFADVIDPLRVEYLQCDSERPPRWPR